MKDTERLSWLISNKAAINPTKGKIFIDFWDDTAGRWEHKATHVKIEKDSDAQIICRQAIDELMGKSTSTNNRRIEMMAQCRSFANGDLIESIIFDDDRELRVGRDCDAIIVVMENGQMSGVPWFQVWKDGKLVLKWNAAKVQGVTYEQSDECEGFVWDEVGKE